MKMKKKKNKKESHSIKNDVKVVENKFSLNDLNNKELWIFTAILTIVYFVSSTFSDGFYMHDEPELFLYASKGFWADPISELLRFRKVGYVLFLALPSLGGFTFLHIFNSILAAVTVMYSYKIIHKLGSKNSFLIYFILGLQPLWFMLAFRNYTEFLAAFILVMTAWNHFNKKYIFAALLLSYAALVRQENHIILGLYFLVLVFNKQWIAAICTGFFTFLHNLVGFFITGELLYLPNKVLGFSESLEGAFPKRGFDFYFIMSDVIFGSISLVLFISYISIIIYKKKKPNWFLLIPVILTFLLYCTFNHETWNIGVGAGNLRYVLTIAPFMVILGVMSLDEIIGFNKKYLLAIFLIPLIFFIGVYQTYDHDFMKLIEDGERNWVPFMLAIITVALLLFPLKKKHYLFSFGALSIFLVISTARTFKLKNEDVTMKKASKWFSQRIKQSEKLGKDALFTENSKVACNHVLFSYFTKDYNIDFTLLHNGIRKEITDTLKKGDLVIWESHYGYRPKLFPGSQPYDDFDKNPDYQKIQYYQSKDNRFMVVFFRKLTD
jgi:hypothetical protein